jgi:GDP-L-fucose synthase
MKQNSCIVVTGANGLAGSAVVKQFRKREFTCVVPLTREDADLMHAEEVMETFARIKPEYVFHAAATVYGLQGNMDNQYKSLFENTLINTNVIHASRLVGVKKIVAMGTNAVYPWPAALPYREATIFDGPPHDGEFGYAHAKRHMLALLEASGMDYTYLVSGNLYGPRDTFDPISGHVLPSLIHKFYEASISPDDVVSIWGDGSAKRDFLFSEDLADIVGCVMGSDLTGAINIGSGQTASIEYVAKRLCSVSGVGYDRVHYDITKPKGRPECYADLSKLRGLGWRPSVMLGDGLKAAYNWYAADRNSRKICP